MMFHWTPQLHERADQLLVDGCSNREVARTIGCHHTTVLAPFPGRGWDRRQAASWAVGSRWGRLKGRAS